MRGRGDEPTSRRIEGATERRGGAWWRALRAYSLPASVGSVAAGGLWARGAAGEGWSWGRLGVAAGAGAALHLAANLWNDLHDWESGTDRAGGSEGSGVLTRGELGTGTVRGMAWSFAALAGVGGVWLAMAAGWGILTLGAAGAAAAWGYSWAKRRGLGEVWAGGWMGVGMAAGGAMAETGGWEWGAVAAGAPLACWTALMMYVNNWRDAEEDARAGVRTAAGRLARRGGREAAVPAAALGAGAWISAGVAAPRAAAVLVLAVLPFWGAWMARAWRKGRPGERAVERMAAMQGAFAVLYLGGWLWA